MATKMSELIARLEVNIVTGIPLMKHVVDAYKAGRIDNHEAKRLQDEVAKLEKRWLAAHDGSQESEDS